MQFITLAVTAFQQNCSIAWCDQTRRGAVIDPGGELDTIVAATNRHGIQLEKIFITHPHIDHAGGAAELAEQLKLPIEGPHREDSFWIDLLPQQSQMFNLPPARKFTPQRWLQNGDTVSFGNVVLEVYHCPGHTPGHVVFYHPPSKVAFVGDVLFRGSIGRTDFPKGNLDALLHSIRTKLWPLGNDVTFVPGHGPTSTFGEERRSNPFVAD